MVHAACGYCLPMDALSRWSVPVFAMLTGFFFLNPQKELPLSKLYGKYIARIAVALVFWSLFYAFTQHRAYYPFGSQEAHFWYLGMCIGLYMAIPIMRYIAQNKYILNYFCWTWLICRVYFFVGNYITLPFKLSSLIFVDYVGFCLWAYYLSIIELSRKIEIALYLLGILGLIINVVGFRFSIYSVFASGVSITNMLTAFAVFYMCSHYSFKGNEQLNKAIQIVSECTFGIFLIHLWILKLIIPIRNVISFPPVAAIVMVLIVFVGGFVATYIIKKIPILNKWIV